MKRIVKLIILLALFVQTDFAQTVTTEKEYKLVYDSLVSRLTLAEKDANDCVGQPFSKFIKLLDKYGMKITQLGGLRYDSGKLYPQEVFGISLVFTDDECYNFVWTHDLQQPYVYIYFNESKPYEDAERLIRKHKSHFTEEMEAFYSDAVIKSIDFYFMDDMYSILYKTKKEKKEKAEKEKKEKETENKKIKIR